VSRAAAIAPDRAAPHGAAPARRRTAPYPFVLALAAFACGGLSGVRVELLGELYLGELLLVPVGLLALLFGRGRRLLDDPAFWGVLAAGLLTLAGYVLSDIVAGTPAKDHLRGWARVAFTLSDFACLAALFVADKRLPAAFALGLGGARIAASALAGLDLFAHWKFGFAPGVSLALLALAPLVLPAAACGVALLAYGVWSVLLDFRTLGGVMVAIGALLLARAARTREPLRLRRGLVAAAAAAALGAVVLLAALAASDDQYGARRDSSNAGRRLDLTVGLPAVLESPWLGRGSWALSTELGAAARAALADEVTDELSRRHIGSVRVYFPHSQLIQAWFEGGLLGLAFFLAYLLVAARALADAALRRPADPATPLVLYFLLMGLWSLFMSPWGGTERFTIAAALASAFLVRAEARRR
jgi:O-antigen ligase